MVERTLGSHSQGRVEEDGQAYHSLCRDRYRQMEARRGNRWQLRAVASREHGGRSQGIVGVAAAPQSQTHRDRGGRRVRNARRRWALARQYPDLAERLDLIHSVGGAGLPTAVAILVRMPEIGRLTREQVAALAGLAPYDDDSGEQVGARHIDGGRERLRRALYLAALPASFRWNPQLIALYQRLRAAGTEHKRALIACARKLLIFVNTVVARGTPWQDQPPPTAVIAATG